MPKHRRDVILNWFRERGIIPRFIRVPMSADEKVVEINSLDGMDMIDQLIDYLNEHEYTTRDMWISAKRMNRKH